MLAFGFSRVVIAALSVLIAAGGWLVQLNRQKAELQDQPELLTAGELHKDIQSLKHELEWEANEQIRCCCHTAVPSHPTTCLFPNIFRCPAACSQTCSPTLVICEGYFSKLAHHLLLPHCARVSQCTCLTVSQVIRTARAEEAGD